ncbi:MAG: hypothetical protein VX733_05075 [Candidatus Latescibacterota bacterium]|nr:hypothetical protein [Candidatus Latescibacterota bacterium]
MRHLPRAYLFSAPGLLLLGAFCAYPVLDTLWLSFHKHNIFHWAQFVGMANSEGAFRDELFCQC